MKRICLVTGGTGGHIYPALALADKLKQRDPDCEILFVGNEDRMEADLVPQAGYPFASLKTKGLEGSIWHKMQAGVEMVTAISKAKKILKDFKPDVVCGFGGYVSAPLIMAASRLHIPVVVHEQNSLAGKANRLAARKADKIAICYDKAAQAFDPAKTVFIGNPRGSVAAASAGDPAYVHRLGLDPHKRTILVMMGSLGSSTMNEVIAKALSRPIDDLQFVIAAGKDNAAGASPFDNRQDIITVPYVDTLKIYPFIDGLVCRAGATTIAEITAIGLPAILIPSPYVANNHQYYNASVLKNAGAAELVEEKDLLKDPMILARAIHGFFGSKDILESARSNARKLGRPHAADDLADLLEKTAERSRP